MGNNEQTQEEVEKNVHIEGKGRDGADETRRPEKACAREGKA